MPLANRVSPFGELLAVPDRGLVYGNRGCLHDDQGQIRRAYASRRWIACRLSFRGWHRAPLMQPGRFTELFFLDEATALAAGHRPCALCRRADYDGFVRRWADQHPGETGADVIDRRLQAERLDPAPAGAASTPGRWTICPTAPSSPAARKPGWCTARYLRRWTPAGYAEAVPRPSGGREDVLTPPSLWIMLGDGVDSALPLLHPSAGRLAGARQSASLKASSVTHRLRSGWSAGSVR